MLERSSRAALSTDSDSISSLRHSIIPCARPTRSVSYAAVAQFVRSWATNLDGYFHCWTNSQALSQLRHFGNRGSQGAGDRTACFRVGPLPRSFFRQYAGCTEPDSEGWPSNGGVPEWQAKHTVLEHGFTCGVKTSHFGTRTHSRENARLSNLSWHHPRPSAGLDRCVSG